MNNMKYRSPRNKAPIYTSDKRAKFSQRTSKKWVRLATVFGYIVSVSIPAILLSIYYLCFWDPQYVAKYPDANASGFRSHQLQVDSKNGPRVVRYVQADQVKPHLTQLKSARNTMDEAATSDCKCPKQQTLDERVREQVQDTPPPPPTNDVHLKNENKLQS